MHTPQPYTPDPAFRATARKHQSDYREKILRIDFDPADPQARYGNILPEWAARKGYILYRGYREQIAEAVEARYGKKYNKPLYANVLRSEHIPLNIFVPMGFNREAARAVISRITRNPVSALDDIKIEYAPSPADRYLDDKTAFDAWIGYRDAENRPCGIGVEVKYTEQAYKIKKESKKYRDIVGRENPRYAAHTAGSGYYTGNPYPVLMQDDYRQIWRNHLLGAAMVARGDIHAFTSIHLYPRNNSHFTKTVPEYRKLLSEKGKTIFTGLTYEQLFSLLNRYYTHPEEQKWISYLNQRYIF